MCVKQIHLCNVVVWCKTIISQKSILTNRLKIIGYCCFIQYLYFCICLSFLYMVCIYKTKLYIIWWQNPHEYTMRPYISNSWFTTQHTHRTVILRPKRMPVIKHRYYYIHYNTNNYHILANRYYRIIFWYQPFD